MGDSARFRGCVAELNVFLEGRIESLEKQLMLSESMYRVAIKSRDLERRVSDELAACIKEFLEVTSGQASYGFMEHVRERAKKALELLP